MVQYQGQMHISRFGSMIFVTTALASGSDIGINFQHWCRPGSMVVNSVYRLDLAQFVRDEKTNCDKISD